MINESLNSKLQLVSKIYAGQNDKNYNEECSYRLLCAICSYIELYSKKYNFTIYDIKNTLQDFLNQMYNNINVLEKAYNENNEFSLFYERYIAMRDAAIAISEGSIDDINIYQNTIEKLNIYTNFLNE